MTYAQSLHTFADIIEKNPALAKILDETKPHISIFPDTLDEAHEAAEALGASTHTMTNRKVSVFAYKEIGDLDVHVFASEEIPPTEWDDETKNDYRLELKKEIDARQQLMLDIIETMLCNGVAGEQAKNLVQSLFERFTIAPKEQECDDAQSSATSSKGEHD